MVDYSDGSSFVGLDDAVLTADEAVDTWLDHRMWSNSSWLAAGKDAATLTLTNHNTSAVTTYTGSRAFKGVGGWSTVSVFPFQLTPGLTGFKLVFDYLVYTFGATTNNLEARFRLDGAVVDGAETTFTLADTTGGGGPEYTDHTQTITFDSTYKGRAKWVNVVVEIRSTKGDQYETLTIGDNLFGRRYFTPTNANGDLAPGSTAPATNTYDVKMLTDSNGREFEILAIDPNSTSPEHIYYWPVNYGPYEGANVSIHDVNWLSLRSMSVQPTYDIKSIIAVTQAELAANTPSRGLTASRQSKAITELSKRHKLLGIGPSGTLYSADESWPDDYAKIWTFQTANAAADQMDSLVEHSIKIDRENPIIKVKMLLVGTFFSGQVGGDPNYRDRGLTSWTFTTRVRQLQDGDTAWSSSSINTTSTADINISTYALTPACRMFQSMALMHDFGQPGTTTPETFVFAYSDGQLQGADFDFIQPVDVEIDLSGVSFDTEQTQPVRLNVTAALDEIKSTPWGTYSTTITQNRTRVWCVGYSIWSKVDG